MILQRKQLWCTTTLQFSSVDPTLSPTSGPPPPPSPNPSPTHFLSPALPVPARTKTTSLDPIITTTLPCAPQRLSSASPSPTRTADPTSMRWRRRRFLILCFPAISLISTAWFLVYPSCSTRFRDSRDTCSARIARDRFCMVVTNWSFNTDMDVVVVISGSGYLVGLRVTIFLILVRFSGRILLSLYNAKFK
uniref:Uncharacterized protein n=1 Tax=Opuntia streptacantha TaxID=393608 RepID=A0A7C8YNB6_OPUST